MTRGGHDTNAATPSSPSPRGRTDAEIIARIERAKNNREMAALWKGDTPADYPSVSAGDAALCTFLALSTGNDEPRIDGLFRQSGRYRDEWNATLDYSANGSAVTYGAITVRRAIRACEEREQAIVRACALAPLDVVDSFHQTDTGNAEYFEARWGPVVRRDCARQEWFVFTGQHWSPNQTGEVERLALRAIRGRQAAALEVKDEDERKAAFRWAIQSENRSRLEHLLECAATMQSIAVDGSGWDTRPLLLGVQNGVIDLETGKLRDGTPADGITKVAPVLYNAHARCPRFERFMLEIFASAPELVPYLQRCLGYALTGLTTEQVFWILWGHGANGKSTLVEVFLQAVLGARDYGWIMPFPAAGWSNTMTEYHKASLVGRRLVTASEVTHGGHLNEEFVKALTGQDTINARHPYGRPFQFVPNAKLFLRVNERPVIRDQSHGMWRRPKLVPFIETFPVDIRLGDVLRAEVEGILMWAIRGCLEWQRHGLLHPPIVEVATAAYRSESDPLTRFLDACCVLGNDLRVGGKEAFGAYHTWCEAEQLPADERLSQTTFGTLMKARFPDVGTLRKVIYAGVGLLSPSSAEAAPSTPTPANGDGR